MNKERLEEIRKDKAFSNDDAVIKNSHYEWLIEQAERVQVLEKQLEKSRNGLYNCNMCYERAEKQNKFHFRKIKQLKDWERDLSAVLVFKSDMDEETRNNMIRYRDLLVYAIEQIERVQELEEIKNVAIKQIDVTQRRNERLEERVQELEEQNKELLEGLATIGNAIHEGEISGRGTDENLILEVVDKHWRNMNELCNEEKP